MTTPWYVIQVRPSAEKKVAETLSERGVETYVPVERVTRVPRPTPEYPEYDYRRNRGRYSPPPKARVQERPMAPGYVFARIAPEAFPLVHKVEGAVSVYMNNGSPMRVDPWQLFRLWCAEQLSAFDRTRPRARRAFRKGERVCMTSGEFEGEFGAISKLKGNKRATVILERVRWTVNAEFEQMDSAEAEPVTASKRAA